MHIFGIIRWFAGMNPRAGDGDGVVHLLTIMKGLYP